MICQDCGVEAPTKYVEFHQIIGLLIARIPSSVQGQLCKSCIHSHFWSKTGTTLVLGWWGMISLVCTPIFILNNVGRYLFCLGMPSVPPGARPPELTDEAIEKIQPFFSDLVDRLNHGEKLPQVTEDIATRAGVTAG